MQVKKQVRTDDYTDLYKHIPTRPIRWVKDIEGYGWLCAKNVNPHDDLRKQNCWRCDEIAFPTGGR